MQKTGLKYVTFLTFMLVMTGCGSGLPSDLEYQNVVKVQWLQADVVSGSSGQRVMWFQLFDRSGDQQSINFYRNAPDEVRGHPARVSDNSIWVLVAGRFEIRLNADNNAGSAGSPENMTRLLEAFDLRAMAAYEGEALDGEGLVRFLPDLPGGG